MSKKNVLSKLHELGYDRAENAIEAIPGKILTRKDFSGKMLNHTIMEHITFLECNFDEASITGSIFRHCKFINCSLYQADLEFCEFYSCSFESKEPIVSSFNESSFMDTEFHQIHFHSCTFTSTLFQKSAFYGVNITVSTMENALFRECFFCKMDLRLLNMDYIELDHPHMEDVVLPLDQVPFIFGAMPYLKDTKDSVKISKGEHGTMAVGSFFKKVVPLLCTHFRESGQFFPLANIYYSTEQTDCGYEAITQGLIASIAIRDFRMIKYYCKLIAYTGVFCSSALHNLYHNYICRLYPQNSESLDVPNYARHIMEIKALLFNSDRKASFFLTLGTNIRLFENWKLGNLLKSIFSLAKYNGAVQDNDIEVSLRQNSPLQLTIQLSGNEEQLAAILLAYLRLVGTDESELRSLPVVSQRYAALPMHTDLEHELEKLVQEYRKSFQEQGILLTMREYYVRHFQQLCDSSEPVYYFNSNAFFPEHMLIHADGGTHGADI